MDLIIILGILLGLSFIVNIVQLINQFKSLNNKGRKRSSKTVPEEKYKKLLDENKRLSSKAKELERLQKKYEDLVKDHGELTMSQNRFAKIIHQYKQINDELMEKVNGPQHDNNKPRKNQVTEPNTNVTVCQDTVSSTQGQSQKELKESTADVPKTNIPKSDIQEPKEASEINPKLDSKEEATNELVIERKDESIVELKKETINEQKTELSKEKIMYASFPRLAGNSTYFSDLSDNVVDDSYFELKINVPSGKATFKPLDFMRIRNYDPTMYAVSTEGVKANLASTVIGVEPGKAHIEGADWIIDNLAKIKLA